MNILKIRIKDTRFLDLINKALKAGYMEFRKYSHTIAGTPQGSIISPILSNIYLDKLDKFVEELKNEFDVGTKSSINPLYKKFANKKDRAETIDESLAQKSRHKILTQTPYKLDIDPDFKKLEYIRYVDDLIIGVRGSKKDCAKLIVRIKEFLKDEMNLELPESKTKIRNFKNEHAEFLSVRLMRSNHVTYSKREETLKGDVKNMRLLAPIDKITKKLYSNEFMKKGRPYPKFK